MSTNRRLDIQGLRAIAVLLVVAFHAELPIPRGFLGVDVFFVISGFVITEMLAREIAISGQLKLSTFYARRVRRIVPAAGLLIATVLIASVLLSSPVGNTQINTGSAGAASSLFVSNFWFMTNTGGYFQPDATLNPLLHMWSLSVEEQFYIAFPLLLLTVFWLNRKTISRWGLLPMLGLGLASAAYAWTCVHSGSNPVAGIPGTNWIEATGGLVAFFSPLARACEFLTGAALALAVRGRELPRPASISLGFFGMALLAVVSYYEAVGTSIGVFGATAAAAAIIASGNRSSRSRWEVPNLLSLRPLTWLGDRSYSWYLWHWPFIVFAFAWFGPSASVGAAAALISLLPALASYMWLESPIRSRKWLAGRQGLTVIVVLGAVIPCLMGIGLVRASDAGWGDAETIRLRQAVEVPPGPEPPTACSKLVVFQVPGGPAPCVWQVPNSKGTILLLGDSHARQYVPTVVQAGNELGYDVQVAFQGGCRSMLLPSAPTECKSLVSNAFGGLEQSDYSLVILANSSLNALSDFSSDLLAKASTGETTQQKVISGWANGLREFITHAKPTQPFLVIGDNPTNGESPVGNRLPDCLRPSNVIKLSSQCGVIPESRTATARETAAAEREAVSGLPNVTYIDAGDYLCPAPQSCVLVEDGVPLSMDGGHLTAYGVQRVAPLISQGITTSLAQSPQ